MIEYSIETFRGDAEALEAMARAAWLDEYGADSYPNLYRPDYVAYLLRLAGDPELAIAAYHGDRPVGFLLNLPRRMVLRGVEHRAALSCSLVVNRESLRRGVAKAILAAPPLPPSTFVKRTPETFSVPPMKAAAPLK